MLTQRVNRYGLLGMWIERRPESVAYCAGLGRNKVTPRTFLLTPPPGVFKGLKSLFVNETLPAPHVINEQGAQGLTLQMGRAERWT